MSVEGKGDDSGRTRTPPPVDEGPLEPVNGVVYPPTNPPAARYLDTSLDSMYIVHRQQGNLFSVHKPGIYLP